MIFNTSFLFNFIVLDSLLWPRRYLSAAFLIRNFKISLYRNIYISLQLLTFHFFYMREFPYNSVILEFEKVGQTEQVEIISIN